MTLIDIVVHRGDITVNPMTTFDISLDAESQTRIYQDMIAAGNIPIEIDIRWSPGRRYNTTVFFWYREGRSYAVTNFTSIHDGEWHQTRFMNNGSIWTIDYRTQVPSTHETDTPDTPAAAG